MTIKFNSLIDKLNQVGLQGMMSEELDYLASILESELIDRLNRSEYE